MIREIPVIKTKMGAVMPYRDPNGGYVLSAPEDLVVLPGCLVRVDTGLRIGSPTECSILVLNLERILARGVMVHTTVYTHHGGGSLIVNLQNMTALNEHRVKAGDPIAQFYFMSKQDTNNIFLKARNIVEPVPEGTP